MSSILSSARVRMLGHRLGGLAACLIAVTICVVPTAFAQTDNEDPLSISAILKPTRFDSHQIGEVELKLSLPPQYKAYEEQFRLELDSPTNFKLSQFTISPVHEFYDDFSKKQRRGIMKEAVLRAPIEAPVDVPASGTIRLILTYQACTKSYCLFPIEKKIEIGFQGANPTLHPGDVPSTAPSMPKHGFFSQKFSDVFKHGLVWTFVFVFFAGVLTSFTPCIFPMIPITLAVLGRNSHLRSRWQSVIVSHAYVFGIATTYALLGLLAASTGALFGAFMSSPWVLSAVCVVFLVMALSMLGLYDIEAPASVQKWTDKFTKLPGPIGAFMTGVVSGIVASPCVGPVLVGVLTYVAQTQNLWLGFWLLFVFALGMGQLFLILGLSTHLTKKLPRSGPWLDGVKRFFGILLLGVFYYYLSFLISVRWFEGAFGLGLIVLGSLMHAFDRDPKSNWQRLMKGASLAAILFGGLMIAAAVLNLRAKNQAPVASSTTQEARIASPTWLQLSEESLAQAKADGKPVIIDFAAEWCAACHELDEKTYAEPRVLEAAKGFVMLRFDATNDSPELDHFRKKYEIVGLPWVVFINNKGEWLKDLTLAGFEAADPFLERMRKAQ